MREVDKVEVEVPQLKSGKERSKLVEETKKDESLKSWRGYKWKKFY